MRRRRYKGWIGTMVMVLGVGAYAGPASASTPVTNLTLASKGDFIELTVVGGGRLLCDHFTEPATQGRPFRIVLDFCNARQALGRLNFDGLPQTQIQRIRTSQFATTPQEIVRVVLDMRREATYSLYPDGTDLTIRIVDPSAPAFAVWQARPATGDRVTTSRQASKPDVPDSAEPIVASVDRSTATVRPAPVASPAPVVSGLRVAPVKKTRAGDDLGPAVSAPTRVATRNRAPRIETTPNLGGKGPGADAKTAQEPAAPVFATSHPDQEVMAQIAEDLPKVKHAAAENHSVASSETAPPKSEKQSTVASAAEALPLPPVPLVFAPGYIPGETDAAIEPETPARVTPSVSVAAGPKQPLSHEREAKTASVDDSRKSLWASSGQAPAPKQSPVTAAAGNNKSRPAVVAATDEPPGGNPPAGTAVAPLPLPPVPLVFAPGYTGEEPGPQTSARRAADAVPIAKVSMTPIGPKPPSASASGKHAGVAGSSGASPMWASTNPVAVPSSPASTMDTRKGSPAVPDDASIADSSYARKPETLLDRLKTKFFGNRAAPRPYTSYPSAAAGTGEEGEVYGPPSPVATLDRKALLARIRQTQQNARRRAGETDAGGVPTRGMLYYDDQGRRDPFEPLVSGQRSGFLTDQLPDVESLRLVGVLRDDVEAIALLENMEGYGYIMRVGDKVQNGSLVTIQRNRALFRVDDYGWSHVVALQLTTRGSDPSKSLGANLPEYPEFNFRTGNSGNRQSSGNKGSEEQ